MVPVSKAANKSPDEMLGKFTIGELKDAEAPEYTQQYDRLIEQLREEDDA